MKLKYRRLDSIAELGMGDILKNFRGEQFVVTGGGDKHITVTRTVDIGLNENYKGWMILEEDKDKS